MTKNIKKHIPQRTCIACHETRPKKELVRLVHTPDGTIEVDRDRKKPGRGAYLCQSQECWEIGLKRGRLEYALRITLSQDNREQFIKYKELIIDEDR